VALFGHKPLTEERLDDAAVNYWPVLPAPRARLLALFGAHPPAFVASGHVHQVRDHAADGLRQIWAPAVSFLIGDAWHPPRGAKYLGWAEHLLHPDGTTEHRLHRLEGAIPPRSRPDAGGLRPAVSRRKRHRPDTKVHDGCKGWSET
jgi:hypothetical protein